MGRFWAYSSVNDNESSLYYLQSRYYDPALCRFINADAFTSTGQGLLGNNMFAYCNNNPIIRADYTGNRYEICDRDLGGFVGGGMFLGGLLHCGARAIYNALTTTGKNASSSFGSESVKSQLGNIEGRFGEYECREAAKSMADYLRKNGKKAEIITIRFIGGRDYIWSDTASKVVSTNGVHVGILYNGIVFCNVHPLGLPEPQWIEDFHGTGFKLVNKVPF